MTKSTVTTRFRFWLWLIRVIGVIVPIGLAASFALTRLMEKLLFKVTPTDPWTFVLLSLLMLVVAVLACYFPARRATQVDPLVALRHD